MADIAAGDRADQRAAVVDAAADAASGVPADAAVAVHGHLAGGVAAARVEDAGLGRLDGSRRCRRRVSGGSAAGAIVDASSSLRGTGTPVHQLDRLYIAVAVLNLVPRERDRPQRSCRQHRTIGPADTLAGAWSRCAPL